MAERASKVDDWSWRQTRRRLATLWQLTRPYKTRTILSVVSLLLATATALAPPFLSKYAVDDGIRQHDLQKLWWIVGAFLFAGLANWGMSYVQTYLTGWVGERMLRIFATSSSATCSGCRSATSSATARA
jgi:ABC-type multidrug transport system, ATPase and permease components